MIGGGFGTVSFSRLSSLGLLAWSGILAVMLMVLIAATGAEARNVPGSASAVQPRIDRAVAFSLLDTAQLTARDAATFQSCEQFLGQRNQPDDARRNPCQWGVSFGGGARYIEGSPHGYDFDFTSGYGSLSIAGAISPSVTLLASVIAETGKGDLDYNDGTLKNVGVGGLLGAIIKLDDALDLSLIGGAEWLNYKTDRTNGLYEGEYDAVRYLLDAQLRAYHDTGSFFVEYGGGVRFIHQDNDAYNEKSNGAFFAKVNSTGFTVLTGIGDLKLGTDFDGIRPYLQATGYVNLIDEDDLAAALDDVKPGDATVSGRFGGGLDLGFIGGSLSFTAGVFVDEDGFQGADGGLKFVKAF